MEIYKPGQGRHTRNATFLVLVTLVYWGSRSLYNWLVGFGVFEPSVNAESIPFIDQKLGLAFILANLVFVAASYGVFVFLNRPRPAELLITTEVELKKVAWPSWADAKNSSAVVLVFVVLVAGFLVCADIVLSRIFGLILG